MAIVQEIEAGKFVHTYSDDRYYIIQADTESECLYEEAWDLLTSPHTYVESDEKIPEPEPEPEDEWADEPEGEEWLEPTE